MSVSTPLASAQEVSTRYAAIPGGGAPSFDERWAAWQARGAAHDRTVRRRMMFALPILAIVAAVLYGLFGLVLP